MLYRIAKHIVAAEGHNLVRQDVKDATKHLYYLYRDDLSSFISRSIKREFGVAGVKKLSNSTNVEFPDLKLRECPDGEAGILECLVKSYDQSIISIQDTQDKEIMKIDTASDQGGVKHITVNLKDKNVRVCNAKQQQIPQLSNEYTGDISFLKAMIRIITARFCTAKVSKSCPIVLWKKYKTSDSVCLTCQHSKKQKRYEEKQSVKKKVLRDVDENLKSVNPHFHDHVVNQMDMANSNDVKYTARFVPWFCFANLLMLFCYGGFVTCSSMLMCVESPYSAHADKTSIAMSSLSKKVFVPS